MRIYAITTTSGINTNPKRETIKKQNNRSANNVEILTIPKSYINFGWCMPHLQAMTDINKQFNQAISKAIKTQESALESINAKNL